MHSWDGPDGPGGKCITIHYNGNPEGSVLRINLPAELIAATPADRHRKPEPPHLERWGDNIWWEIELPYDVLQAFVLDMIRNELVGQVEDADYVGLRELVGRLWSSEPTTIVINTLSALQDLTMRCEEATAKITDHLEDHPVEPHMHPHSHSSLAPPE